MIKQGQPLVFPLDIDTVKEYGVAQWQREFFWPVSDKEFVAMCEDLEECVRRHIEDGPQAIGDTLMIKRNLVSEYWHFLHALKVLDAIKKRGMEPAYSDAAFWYKDILEKTLSDKADGISGKRTRLYRVQGSMFRRWEMRLKRRVRELLLNCAPRKVWGRLRGDVIYLYGTPDEFIAEYCKRLRQWVILTAADDWLPRLIPKFSNDLQSDLQGSVARLIVDVRTVADKYGIPLLENHHRYLQQFTENQVFEAAQVLQAMRQSLNGRQIHLLVSTVHDQIQRALALEVRRAGGTVTAFTHGGHIGYLNSPTIPFNEFALSDEFVAYTGASVKIFEELQRRRSALRDNTVHIMSGEGLFYKQFHHQHAHEMPPQRVKKIMLVGFPMAPWRKPQGSALFWPIQLDLELRLVRLLRGAGYDVLYKAHPDRLKEIAGIFDGSARVIKEPFEEVVGMADAFVFPVIRTTAFNFGLCTSKPVVGLLMRDEYPPPLPAPMELLKKRCHLLYTRFDARNRIVFEEHQLLDVLARAPQMPNMEFVTTYLFP